MAVPTPPSGKEWLIKICRWFVLHPYWALLLLVLAVLAPFLAKPFNIDDPLFLWTAQQIHAHPADPYGFKVDWYGFWEPMWRVTQNPPLACYYLALAGEIFGWSEVALHFACLLPAVMAIWGTHRLASRFCQSPMLAALATLCTPVFLVSSTTVMCDVMMLAFWVWAVVWWLEGIERDDVWRLGGASLLVALAALTKYFGACLVPLLAAYGVMEKRRLGRWAAWLLIPLAALCAYQWGTWAFYGHALLTEATEYAKFAKLFLGGSGFASSLTALTFTGGCLAVVIFFSPGLCRRRVLAWLAAGTALLAAAIFGWECLLPKPGEPPDVARASLEFQMLFWALAGLGVLVLVVADVWDRRDARSWLLALWVLGTFSFTAFFNWTINGRSILPMTPAVGILIARRWEQNGWSPRPTFPRAMMLGLAASAAFALLAAQSDFQLAVVTRQSARLVCATYQSTQGNLWFQGHWGFQYYMDQAGAWAMDSKHPRLKPGDTIALPMNNASYPLDMQNLVLRETISIPGPRWFSTWNPQIGAGFYASTWGPLPFAAGRMQPEIVSVYVVRPAAAEPPKQ